jgi:hypothetical protein
VARVLRPGCDPWAPGGTWVPESPGRPRPILAPVRRATSGKGLIQSGLLDAFVRTGVWPDSVQAFGGMLSFRLPTAVLVWLSFGLQPVGRRVEAWLQRGLPSS